MVQSRHECDEGRCRSTDPSPDLVTNDPIDSINRFDAGGVMAKTTAWKPQRRGQWGFVTCKRESLRFTAMAVRIPIPAKMRTAGKSCAA
jgi:hypothetical protein